MRVRQFGLGALQFLVLHCQLGLTDLEIARQTLDLRLRHGSDVRHGHEAGSGAGSLKGWIDHLIAEKRTIEDDEYRQHNSEALRFMVEDRFGHAAQPTRMKYSKVKPPRLADPNRPHDQMDNFPSGRTDAIVSKLSKQPGKAAGVTRRGPFRKAAGLENIKKPWGW